VSEIIIRDFESREDYTRCANLQIEVWGLPEIEVVPDLELIVVHHYGGVCIGAFDDEQMIGFVCGMVARDKGRVFHHSHILGVLPAYRRRGIGEKLKWEQRDRVLAQGLDFADWTFDPLQAPNAHLNINRLGVEINRYRVNFYGEGTSPLHGAMPTDRFVAEWWLEKDRVEKAKSGRLPERAGWEELPHINRTRWEGEHPRCEEIDLGREEAELLVEIPPSLPSLIAEDLDLAMDWRLKTRSLFQAYLGRGYSVAGFHRYQGRTFYRLEKSK
jgi:predicted GNAT superfamily acetyltransferase